MTKDKKHTLFKIQQCYKQWIVDYKDSLFVTISWKPQHLDISLETWYKCLNHPYKQAVQHLSCIIWEMSIIDADAIKVFINLECEVCKFNKIKKIILRYSIKKFLKPYERVHFNIVKYTEGFNRNNYIFHFYCESMKMNHIYINTYKSSSLHIIKDFTAYIKKRFNLNIKIFKLNNEIFLMKKFKT